MPQDYLTNPCLKTYPFGCADCEADAAAFKSGALRAPFIQRLDLTLPWFLFHVKKIQQKVSQKTGVDLIDGQGLPLPAPYRL